MTRTRGGLYEAAPPPPPRAPATSEELYGGQPNAFTPLPDDLLINVLRFLPLDALVCCGAVSKRFNKAASTPSLYSSISFTGVEVYRLPSMKSITRLVQRAGDELRVLDLSSLPERQLTFSSDSLLNALVGTPVRELYLLGIGRSCGMRVPIAERLAQGCPHLQAGSILISLESAGEATRAVDVLPSFSKAFCKNEFLKSRMRYQGNLLVPFLERAAESGAKLTELDVSDIYVAYTHLQQSGSALATLLSSKGCHLAKLDLTHAESALRGDAMVDFCRALGNNNSVRELSLAHSSMITPPAAAVQQLFASLSVNTGLVKLNLDHVKLRTQDQVAQLADALAANSTLEELRLGHCFEWWNADERRKTDARPVVAALGRNRGLRRLSLLGSAQDAQSSDILRVLAESLKTNTTLQLLDIEMLFHPIIVDKWRTGGGGGSQHEHEPGAAVSGRAVLPLP